MEQPLSPVTQKQYMVQHAEVSLVIHTIKLGKHLVETMKVLLSSPKIPPWDGLTQEYVNPRYEQSIMGEVGFWQVAM